jgi:FkbM family methyltransferase
MTNSLRELRGLFVSGQLSKADFIERMHAHHRLLYEYADLLHDCELAGIEISAGDVVMSSLEGLKFHVDPADWRIAPVEALNFGRYENDDAGVLESLFGPGQTILDVGANIGWYALHAARRFPSATVHAFEPVPRTFEYLQRNVQTNNVKNVVFHNFGLSDRAGHVQFFVYPEGSGGASMANTSGRTDVVTVMARIKRLDDLDLSPDVIKIDVEGAELFAFRGGMETLRKYRPAVFSEMLRKWAAKFDYHPNEIINLLGGLDYQCFYFGGDRLQRLNRMTDDVTATNFLFLHSDRHADRIHEIETA